MIDIGQITAELGKLSWQQFAVLASVVSLVDFVGAVIAAVSPPINYFSWQAAAKILKTHVMERVFPIAGLAFIAQSIPKGDLHDLVWLVGACGGLALYVAETVKSLMSSARVAKAISDEVIGPPISVTPATIETPGTSTPVAVVETESGTTVVPDPASILGDQAVPPDEPEV
jgi:hypothetical protein